MGGISTGGGIFSGINSNAIIDQLLALDARPRTLAQRRIIQLQQQQAAYLDINSRLSGIKEAASAFRVSKIFQSQRAASSDTDVLTAVASTSASPGSYQFIVDRLVSTQQFLSKGFADKSTSGLSAGSFTFESADARLDRDTSLSDLNGGSGVERGKIIITQGTNSATVDLSKSATVAEVLDAINNAGTVDVDASVSGGKIVLSTSGAAFSVANDSGSTTAASLGIAGSSALIGSKQTLTGSSIYTLATGTSLQSLNDSNGVFVGNQVGQAAYDFTITVGTTAVNVNIGNVYDAQSKLLEAGVTTVGGVLERINEALAAGLGNADVTASIAADGASLKITDTQNRQISITENPNTGTTAADLGILTASAQTGTVNGKKILAGLNSTLGRAINGGDGIAGDGTISIVGRDGVNYSVTIDTGASLSEILAEFSADTSGKITASLNAKGTGILLTDATGSSANNLVVLGTTAESLNIDTGAAGVAASTVDSGNLQHQYLTLSTRLDTLNGEQGIGTGTFRITDPAGVSAVVDIDSDAVTLGDVIKEINSRGLTAKARINAKGDGIELYEDYGGGSPGAAKIKVEEVSGNVATRLNLKGEAAGTGAQNTIDGSFERTVTFDPADTLEKVASKINQANVGVSASIIKDGAGAIPYRLSMTARGTGAAGRTVIETGAFDLGLKTIDDGKDAKVFFGSSDPAKAVLLVNSSNSLDSILDGVTIDLKSVSDEPVTLTVSRDNEAIESAVTKFIESFNQLVERIDQQSRYVKDTDTRGPLLGDSTVNSLKAALYTTVQGEAIGISGPFERLADLGVRVGSGGKLEVDRDRLREAMEEDAQAVADLFAARELKPKGKKEIGDGIFVEDPDAPDEFISLGVAGRIEELANSYINSVNGTLTLRNKTIDDQIAMQNKRIEAMTARLATRRAFLERQFQAMESAIGQLQQQQSALASIQSIG